MHGWTEAPEFGWKMLAASWCEGAVCESVSTDRLKQHLDDPDRVVWYHLQVSNPNLAETALRQVFGFNPIAARDAVEWTPRPSLHDYGSHLFFSAYAVRTVGNEEVFREIAVFMSANFMVTVVSEDAPEVERWFSTWKSDPINVGSHPVLMVHNLLDEIVDDYFPITDEIENQLDELEERIFADGRGQAANRSQEILAMKWRLNAIRRHVSPMRDIANGLLSRNVQLVPMESRVYIQDIYDHCLRVLERVDLNRDIVSDLVSTHLTVISNELNVVMRVLTVVSTILMSMSLVAGIYGMNFKRMPELEWANGYPMALGLMAGLGFFGAWLFRKLRWL